MTQLSAAVHASGFDIGINNATDLGAKLGGLAVILVGVWVIWQAHKGKLSKVLGSVGVVLIGVTLIVLGLGFATAGKSLGSSVLSFFGFTA